jgi:hypothetical protein
MPYDFAWNRENHRLKQFSLRSKPPIFGLCADPPPAQMAEFQDQTGLGAPKENGPGHMLKHMKTGRVSPFYEQQSPANEQQ